MKLRKFALTILLAIMFINGMLAKDSPEERRLKRNERREEKKLRRQERSRRLRNHRDRIVTAKEGVFNPETVDITQAMPTDIRLHRAEEVVREVTRLHRQRAHNKLQKKQNRRQNDVSNNQQTTTTTVAATATANNGPESATTSSEYLYFEPSDSNMTWSGDDPLPINGTFNDTRYFDVFNSTFSNETLSNETSVNVTSTPNLPKTTPDPSKLNIFRIKQRNRMMRIIMIQTEILNRLGFKQQPNVNVSATLTEEARKAYANIIKDIKTDDDDQERDLYEEDYYAKRYIWDLPSCETPRKSDQTTWAADGDLFRLYFDIKLNHRLDEETRVSAATLSLYKKPFTGCECELISKDNKGKQQIGQARRRRHVDTALGDVVHEADSDDDEDDEEEEEETVDGEQNHTDKITVTLYKYNKPVKKSRKGIVLERRSVLESIHVSKRQEGWVKFRIGDVVASWLKNPKQNFGLVLVAKDSKDNVLNANLLFEDYNCSNNNNQSHYPIPISLALPGSSVSERNRTTQHLHANQTYPYLEVITKNVPVQEENIRFRRDLSKRRTKGCARQEMYVSFAELGWSDWIIQPLGFDAGYCKGTCSTVVDDPSGSLKIKHFTSKLPDGVEFTQFECCGPSKLKPLQILHFDQNGKMAVSIFDNFIITQCGCRP